MVDSLLYSVTDEHLTNLERCGSRDLRRAYLALVLAALNAGYQVIPRPKGTIRELQIRDADDAQPFAAVVDQGSLLFQLRQPALHDDPELAAKVQARFADRMAVTPNSRDDVRIPIRSERDAEEIAELLFIPGYAARRST